MNKIVPTTNEEVDRQLGGGLPFPSLIIIEGEHGTGKSAIAAQFMQGILADGNNVLFITESNIREYIENMKMISFNFARPFLQGKLSILPLYVYGAKWSQKLSAYLLPVISRYIGIHSKTKNCVIIDSFSLLATYADTNTILDFFTRCKNMVSTGMSIIMIMHPSAVPPEVGLRIKSACDGYLRLRSASIAGKDVKVTEVVKLIGSSSQVTSQFSFEVDTTFGIKIVPLSLANA